MEPCFDTTARLFCGILQECEIGRSIVVGGLPLLVFLVADLKRCDAEGAFDAFVFPDAHMDRSVPKLVYGFFAVVAVLSLDSGAVGDCVMAGPFVGGDAEV
jgi:hypothetical protein